MRKYFAAGLIVSVFLLTIACIHKTGNQPVSGWERVTTDNAIFAQINNSVEQGTEAVVRSGLLKPQDAVPVIDFTGQVAIIHQQLTAILDNGPNLSVSDLGTVNSLLVQVQILGQTLVQNGALGIKNPKTQQSIAADIQSLVTLAQTLLSEIQAARIGGSR